MKFSFTDIVDCYDAHVHSHIPNYDEVIKKTIQICKLYDKNSCIVDYGSANGATLYKLYKEGFNNLHGVEPVKEMIAASDKSIASYYTAMPDLNFEIIIANWVLHFVEDKLSVLKTFYNNLNPKGTLIISEKVSSNEIVKKFYYDFKLSKGVSKADILQKEENLKGVMHLFSISEYIAALNTIGFTSIEVIDGSWGFVTLMVQK